MAVLSPQIQAERDQKSNAVLRAEIMNKALQTQVHFFWNDADTDTDTGTDTDTDTDTDGDTDQSATDTPVFFC